jgi:hypothetical protein
MAQSDRASIWVYVMGVISKAKGSRYREGLSRKSFVELNQIHVAQGETR